MTSLLKKLTVNPLTIILIVAVIALIGGGYYLLHKTTSPKNNAASEEQDITFDPEGPYALIFPRRDGNAMMLNIKRTASYDKISYELAYNSEGIDRGVVGDIKTEEKKGEYQQEILFGTCSKNVCKYDPDVENGTLILHIVKGDQRYRMTTQWHMQKPDVALGVLSSGDGHMSYKIDAASPQLSLVGFSMVNDLTAAPKLPEKVTVVGKVYAVNPPIGKDMPVGGVSIELASNPPAGSSIFRYNDSKNSWEELKTTIVNSTLKATAPDGGIFAIFAVKS